MAGILIVIKQALTRTIIKQFVVLSMLISAILNFPMLEPQSMNFQIASYPSFGGFIGWPILWILQKIFGNNPFAIKAIIVLLAVGVLAWIIRAFNIRMPQLPSVKLRGNGNSNDMAVALKKVKSPKVVDTYDDEEEEVK